MTTAIAQFMRDLEGAWDAHREALVRRDLAAALAPMAAEPSVVHRPAMTGASGRAAVERFYAGQVLPHLPADLTLSRISRTVDRWRLVEETTVPPDADQLPARAVGSRHPDGAAQYHGPARRHCPSSHRPGAMSSRAGAGPHEPGA